nr:MAG TPA: hypothetical protein [Bacteriophage sp.]
MVNRPYIYKTLTPSENILSFTYIMFFSFTSSYRE